MEPSDRARGREGGAKEARARRAEPEPARAVCEDALEISGLLAESERRTETRDEATPAEMPVASDGPAPRAGSAAGDPPEDVRAAATKRGQHWRQLLAASSPREVLARLLNGDPLGIARVVAERLRARAFVLDADRVFLRSLARCARFAARYRGQPELATWIAERVDEALLDLNREDLEALRSARVPEPEELAAFVDLAGPLGLEPAAMRRVCALFNQLAETDRRAFFALALEGRSLDLLARAGPESATEIARRARRVLEAILAADLHGPSPSSEFSSESESAEEESSR